MTDMERFTRASVAMALGMIGGWQIFALAIATLTVEAIVKPRAVRA